MAKLQSRRHAKCHDWRDGKTGRYRGL